MDDSKDSTSSFPTTFIPDALFEKAGITIQWAGINKIGVHTFKKPTQKEDKSYYAPCDAKVFELRTDSILFDPIVRKLVNESNGTFVSGQNIASDPSARPETIKLSRQYRSIVRACIEDLQKESKKPNKEFYEQYVAIFYNIEFIWHLTEILMVNALPGDVVLPHLLEWIRFHFPSGEMGAAKILGAHPLEPGAEARHPNYWPTVITLILQGHLEPARALLRLHSQADTSAFLEAELVLRTMPVYNVFGGLSVGEFNTRFHSWQATLTTKLENKEFASSKNLQLLMKMISGEALAEMKQHCSTWFELMVATLLYTEPTVKSFDLIFHANRCINQFGGPSRLKLLDEIVLSLLECNLHDVIKKLQLTCDNGWAAAHLTNLLFHCGRLNVIDNKIMSGMPHRLDEELVAEYGTLLMTHRSLWQAGVSYLDHCPALGPPRLRLLLPRVPLLSEKRVNKIIQMALERNMPEVAASVCKVEGMKNIRCKRLGRALNWALQSQDPGFATFLADKVLEHYTREGIFNSLDLLDNLGSCMLVCDRLTFLGKYCEFHQVYRNGDLKKAAGLLISLIASKISPKYFWLTLLTDALPLLEGPDTPVFSSKDTCELMSCLEELVMEGSDHPRSAVVSNEKVRLIRLALSKNLAHAIAHRVPPAL